MTVKADRRWSHHRQFWRAVEQLLICCVGLLFLMVRNVWPLNVLGLLLLASPYIRVIYALYRNRRKQRTMFVLAATNYPCRDDLDRQMTLVAQPVRGKRATLIERLGYSPEAVSAMNDTAVERLYRAGLFPEVIQLWLLADANGSQSSLRLYVRVRIARDRVAFVDAPTDQFLVSFPASTTGARGVPPSWGDSAIIWQPAGVELPRFNPAI